MPRPRSSRPSKAALRTPVEHPAKRSARRPAPVALPDGESARDFSARLRRWFKRNSRDLPWRRTRDPYHVLVSELMLQQTQVSRVLDYYARFLQRFPTLEVLADAPPKRVMESWEGLGYYARARNLHALSKQVTGPEGTGTLPAHHEELRKLPGIGAYTAGRSRALPLSGEPRSWTPTWLGCSPVSLPPRSTPSGRAILPNSGRLPNRCFRARVRRPGCTIRL